VGGDGTGLAEGGKYPLPGYTRILSTDKLIISMQ
jgi:hypothetical protein